MPDDHSTPLGVSLQAAAAHYKVSERTIRRRLATGQLRGEKLDGDQGEVWRIALAPPATTPAPARQDPADPPAPPAAPPSSLAVPEAPPRGDDSFERLLAALARERAEERREYLDRLAAAAVEIGFLRGLLLSLHAGAPDPPADPRQTPAHPPAPAPTPAPGGLLARFRAWRGG